MSSSLKFFTRKIILAGGEARVIDPACGGPAESESESHDESLRATDSPACQGCGSDPENHDETDEEDNPGEFIACNKNEQCSVK